MNQMVHYIMSMDTWSWPLHSSMEADLDSDLSTISLPASSSASKNPLEDPLLTGSRRGGQKQGLRCYCWPESYLFLNRLEQCFSTFWASSTKRTNFKATFLVRKFLWTTKTPNRRTFCLNYSLNTFLLAKLINLSLFQGKISKFPIFRKFQVPV